MQRMFRALPSTAETRTIEQAHATVMGAGDGIADVGPIGVFVLGTPRWLDDNSPATPQGVADRYRSEGTALLSGLGGAFSIVIVDSDQRTVHLAVDRFARQPVFWRNHTGGLQAASSADALCADERPDIDPQGVFSYLFFHMIPSPGSIYRAVNKLPAASCLTWSERGTTVQRYWEPTFAGPGGDVGGLQEGLLQTLSDAVRRDAENADCGAFLSGGLDSSTVSGLLARHRPGADTYSIGFNAPGYDEIDYARCAVKHFGNTGHEYYVTPDDVLRALPKVATAYDEPFGNSSALPALFCAAFARQDGRTRLLAGDGGDELFAGNERYAKQKVFEHYGALPTAARALVDLIARACPDQIPVLRKVPRYVEQARIPLPDRLYTYNYLMRLGADALFHPDFLAAVDTDGPLALSREIYQRPADADTLNRMLYLDWHHTLADNDLRKVGRMCQLAGIEVRYPMLDEEVVALSTRIPSRHKLPGHQLRDFYKRSTRDFLPQRIIDKPKQGFGLPFGVWLSEHAGLSELVEDNLARMRRRHMLAPDFVDRLLKMHREDHAHYYGDLVWVLLSLELWLTSRGFEP